MTTTPATKALLFAEQIQPGTHITAVGADTPHKQELDSAIFKSADRVVVDSISQCAERGDSAHALKQGYIQQNQLIELGAVILDPNKGRTNEKQITIADLTGLATQDICIAACVVQNYKNI